MNSFSEDPNGIVGYELPEKAETLLPLSRWQFGFNLSEVVQLHFESTVALVSRVQRGSICRVFCLRLMDAYGEELGKDGAFPKVFWSKRSFTQPSRQGGPGQQHKRAKHGYPRE